MCKKQTSVSHSSTDVNSTRHTSHFLASACAHFNVTSTLALVWRALHISLHPILMRSWCGCSDSLRSSLLLFAVHLLSYRLFHFTWSSPSSSMMWETSTLQTLVDEDLGTIAEYDPLTTEAEIILSRCRFTHGRYSQLSLSGTQWLRYFIPYRTTQMDPREGCEETRQQSSSQTCRTPSQFSTPTSFQQTLTTFHPIQRILISVLCRMSLSAMRRWSKWLSKVEVSTMRHVSRTHRVPLDWLF